MQFSRRLLGFAVAMGLAAMASVSTSAFAADPVTVYTYHNHPPFVVEAGKGLSYELADYLNRKSKGNPTFKIEVVTRAQLDKLLAAPDFSGAVAWVAPEWLKDKDKTTYLWTGGVMDDANVILSSTKAKIDYKDPASLKGKQFGGIAGHKYAGIDDPAAALHRELPAQGDGPGLEGLRRSHRPEQLHAPGPRAQAQPRGAQGPERGDRRHGQGRRLAGDLVQVRRQVSGGSRFDRPPDPLCGSTGFTLAPA